LIERHGAVSEQVAVAMAEGALRNSPADIAVAVTGVAGPGGGTPAKPVGTVHIACAERHGSTRHRCLLLGGDRDAVRLAASVAVLELILVQLAYKETPS
jgi:nicotinamide-nucleotide amidase